jgi:hypothetical protein
MFLAKRYEQLIRSVLNSMSIFIFIFQIQSDHINYSLDLEILVAPIKGEI